MAGTGSRSRTTAFASKLLDERGLVVAVAESAEGTLDTIANSRPDVILSDIGMLGGYQFVRRLRTFREEEGGRIPAAAVTAFARGEDRTRALFAGYQAHIPKPVNPRELIAVVASLTGRFG